MNKPYAYIKIAISAAILAATACIQGHAQRRITPVNTPATATQPINETKNDTARIHARMRATMPHYHEDNGVVVYIDTITSTEFRDSTFLNMKKPMQYPLWHSVSVGVDIWNPIMRAFGQHYGLIDFSAQLSLHNRYMPVIEAGIGAAKNTPSDLNFTYKTPISPYFRIGMDYNFLYNSSPDYQFVAGVRFGVSPFKYSIEDITISNSYWGEPAHPKIPEQSTTATWAELGLGLKVKIWGPISAGWYFRIRKMLGQGACQYGKPWYVPGYGVRGGAINGSFTISYTFDLSGKNKTETPSSLPGEAPDTIYLPEGTGEPSPADINQGIDAETPGD
ncbi:MAG: DUF6048 family protein [Clostridium sp.]|nr:DUF6048 family protein [Clostridium sp.]